MSSPAYWAAVAVSAVGAVAACLLARRGSPRAAAVVGRLIAVLLVADAITFVLGPVVDGTWSASRSLPVDLCDAALVIAAAACWWPGWQVGVELTWFWGMAGTAQAVVTPDLEAPFPSLTFAEFVVAHVGIVTAALYLVVGLRREPRPGSVVRIFLITLGYACFAGLVDVLTGGNYMYLAHVPRRASLLSVLGPWPWYIASAAGVAIVLFLVLDAPFRAHRVHPAPARVDA